MNFGPIWSGFRARFKLEASVLNQLFVALVICSNLVIYVLIWSKKIASTVQIILPEILSPPFEFFP